jgi:hypothetical protein
MTAKVVKLQCNLQGNQVDQSFCASNNYPEDRVSSKVVHGGGRTTSGSTADFIQIRSNLNAMTTAAALL